MKRTLILSAAFLLSLLSYGQNQRDFSTVDSIMLQIPDSLTYSTTDITGYANRHFVDDESKLRAYFTWLASNISYDLTDKREYIADDELDDYIEGTLRWRRGKCQAYAEVFHGLCKKSGIESKVVMGLVKPGNGAPVVSHAWIAAKNNGRWILIDPTFGSGYYLNGKYVREFDNAFFDADPNGLIKTHYPLDPIWQLREYPASMRSFLRKPDSELTGKIRFNFADSISYYLGLSEEQQLIATRRRMLQWSERNPITDNYLAVMDQRIENFKQQKLVGAYNQCAATYNRVVQHFNEIVANRNLNALNTGQRQSILSELGQMQDSLRASRTRLKQLDPADQQLDDAVIDLNIAISDLLNQTVRTAGKLEKQQ